MREGPKIFVRRSRRRRGRSEAKPEVEQWRLDALEASLRVHSRLNRLLGISFQSLSDAIVAAWRTTGWDGQRLLSGEDWYVCERVLRRANKARHGDIGGRGLREDPWFGRWK